MKKLAVLAPALIAAMGMASVAEARSYEVTVTNLTYGQVLTPPVVISHRASFNVFHAGDAASSELKTLAETGNPMPLAESVIGSSAVRDVSTGTDVIPPGHSMTVTVDATGLAKISVMSMLATTNDAFIAIQGESIPFYGSREYYAPVWDAGTEANTELCDDIPGPPCGGASNMEVTDGAEGFIHIHRGFHGINEAAGDTGNGSGEGLTASRFDWRGPAAKITIVAK
ncbi:MAG: spondin domain-containing protein [Pseudomonadales bacterium]|uniref:Spondin domain-containing protein n=1 Tax=Oleiphilus messinensis TaxID=141451 RepID=A0A1Y0I1C8_9GAMM|nr:spondin domain-containing protein [Oleiphilus messinensis]ARU54268.1 hypothetical protein OLMES_0160 [Oleiphilus messinensis]MCG8611171.1 spondin domain-containing protein [Pseudomonadales bacterium]